MLKLVQILLKELLKLRKTATLLTEERSEVIDKEFDAFESLFKSFLESGSQVGITSLPYILFMPSNF
jgi:hypothetical protein